VHEHVNDYVYVNVVVIVDVHVLVDVAVDGFWIIQLRSGPFEGPTTTKPSVLPEDPYSFLEYTCGFTQFGRRSPFNPAIKFTAAISAILLRV